MTVKIQILLSMVTLLIILKKLGTIFDQLLQFYFSLDVQQEIQILNWL